MAVLLLLLLCQQLLHHESLLVAELWELCEILFIEPSVFLDHFVRKLPLRSHFSIMLDLRCQIKSIPRIAFCKNVCLDRNVEPFRPSPCLSDVYEPLIDSPVVSEYPLASIYCIPAQLEISWHVVLIALLSQLLITLF